MEEGKEDDGELGLILGMGLKACREVGFLRLGFANEGEERRTEDNCL